MIARKLVDRPRATAPLDAVVSLDAARGAAGAWFVSPQPRPGAGLRLFCFPWSGAGASAYRSWADALPPDVELVAVALPGRGERTAEPAYDRLAPLAQRLTRALRTELRANPGPFAFFGHSLGALLAYEVAHRLAWQDLHPQLVVLSGSRTPATAPCLALHRLPPEHLLVKLELMGGTTPDRLRDPGFVARFLPLVRTDLTAAETYQLAASPALTAPVSAWAGSEDWYAPPEDVARWRDLAAGPYRGRLFTGGHFFLSDREQTFAALKADLAWGRNHRPAAYPLAA